MEVKWGSPVLFYILILIIFTTTTAAASYCVMIITAIDLVPEPPNPMAYVYVFQHSSLFILLNQV